MQEVECGMQCVECIIKIKSKFLVCLTTQYVHFGVYIDSKNRVGVGGHGCVTRNSDYCVFYQSLEIKSFSEKFYVKTLSSSMKF